MPDLVPILAHIGLATITAGLITWAVVMGAIITITYWRHKA